MKLELFFVPVVLGALFISVVGVRRFEDRSVNWLAPLRERFLFGIPWGTLVVVVVLVGFYLFVQGGLDHPSKPLVLPFRGWTLLYPVGILTSPLAHTGPSHLTGNLFTVVTVGPIAEFVWSHYPRTEPGTDRESTRLGTLTRTPWVRAVVLFPVATIAVGVAIALVTLGPVIGFSGVVFALGGFALVHYPIRTFVVAVGGSRTVSVAYRTLKNPVLTVTPQIQPASPPWWAEVAIQGHAVGFLLGILLGVWFLQRRDERPSASRLWVAALFYVVTQGLWAAYWIQDASYVLYASVGFTAAVVVAGAVTFAASGTDRELFWDVTERDVGIAMVAIVLAAIAGPGIFANATTATGTRAPASESVTVHGYTVQYTENARNEIVPVSGAIGDARSTSTAGVVVVSEGRGIWTQQVSPRTLALRGNDSVVVGGLGWQRRIAVQRDGWNVVGGGATYRVWLDRSREDGRRTLAYVSDPARASPVIDGNVVRITAKNVSFSLSVVRAANGTVVARAPMPGPGSSVTVGGLELERDGSTLYAVDDDTRVRIAVEDE